jgi:hypothetical protein
MVRDLLMIGSDAGVIFILELPGLLELPGAAIQAVVLPTREGVQPVAPDREQNQCQVCHGRSIFL